MIYLGIERQNFLPMKFHASTRKGKGINGHEVDIYEFKPVKTGGKGQLIGFCSVAGWNPFSRQWVAK